MEYFENTGNWLKILIEKLNMPSTAEFCRKADLNRGLVDKLSKDMHSPRLDTLQKIKDTFPETNMNWVISRKGKVLEDVQDDDEIKLIEMYRAKIKVDGNSRTIQKYFVSVEYFVQDQIEMDELESNATAQDVKDQDLMFYRMQLLFLQYRRNLVSDLLYQASNAGPLITSSIPRQKEKYSDLLDHLNNEILKTAKLITDDELKIPEKTVQDIALKTSIDEDVIADEKRVWTELLEYGQKLEKSNADEKE
tara:strand:- start:434 stop:1183 length:750 start_codon:yes stop_codon:yes gene_type:complete